MFYGAKSFNSNISEWKVHNVTDMNSMFYGAIEFTYDLSDWKVQNTTDTYDMFNGALKAPIPNWYK